jgi:hypothetical protein
MDGMLIGLIKCWNAKLECEKMERTYPDLFYLFSKNELNCIWLNYKKNPH